MTHTKRLAFCDIGTNAILLLIVAIHPDGRFEVLDDLADIPRLGEGVDRTEEIGAEGERRTLEVLRRYLERCRELAVEKILVVGTSALRDAINSGAVLVRWKRQLGLTVRILSGHEEAAYSFLAVQQGLRLGARELVVIDVGGGSTELIWGDACGMRCAVSVNLGAVRLTERFLHSDPVTDKECAVMLALIDEELGRLDMHRADAKPLTLVGIAGTFTTLAAVAKGLTRYSHQEVHGSRLTLTEVVRQVSLYQQMSVAQRKGVPGLEPKRADVILAGAYLVQKIAQWFGASELIVSDQGVRYGLLYEFLGGLKSC